MSKSNGVVIVGGAIAGYNVASRLRKEGYEEKIRMIDAKNTLPYDRSKLSKEWMHKEDKIEPPLFQDKDYFEKNHIEVDLNTKVTAFDPDKKIVQTDKNEEIPYDKLVIATGSSLNKLDAPGADALGIFYLRDHEDALEMKEWARGVEKVAIVGGGFIGLELAASFTDLGLEVTVIEFDDHPLGKIVGEDASKYFVNMHEEHGVRFITGEGGQSFVKDETGKVTKVITTAGREIPTQMVIIGVGVTPDLSLNHPDLEIDGGIVVDNYGETSIPDVYAAGDVAVWPFRNQYIHVAHWEHAYNQGKNIAKNIVAPESHPYKTRPYFWTDQYDQTFERLGYVESWDRIITRGSLDTKKFTLAYVDENNHPLAILFANNSDTRKEVSTFMDSGEAIDEEYFKDMDNPLNK